MTTKEKQLEKMRNNQRNWRINQIETVACHFNIKVRKPGGRHFIFEHPQWIESLCIPAARPIKPIYIKKLLELIDQLEEI